MITKQIVLISRPNGKPVMENFQTNDFELPEIKDKEVLLEAMFLSVDPFSQQCLCPCRTLRPSNIHLRTINFLR